MNKKLEIRIGNVLMIIGLMLVFFMQPTMAQSGEQVQKKQKFSQMDVNKDGKISQNEYSYGPFGQYDLDGDQQLSKKEYRQMNKAKQKAAGGTANGTKQQQQLKDGSGAGQQKMTGTKSHIHKSTAPQDGTGNKYGGSKGNSGKGGR